MLKTQGGQGGAGRLEKVLKTQGGQGGLAALSCLALQCKKNKLDFLALQFQKHKLNFFALLQRYKLKAARGGWPPYLRKC